jgi:dCTP deaminase
MLLSDRVIRAALKAGRIGIDPYEPEMVQPASVDVRLDREFAVLTAGPEALDPAEDSAQHFERVVVDEGAALHLEPGQCALGSTYERLFIPSDMTALVHGKSSLGRLFLLVHATAGLLDAGWSGHVTLELANLGPRPLLLWPGMRIAQVTYEQLVEPAAKPYGHSVLGSRYQTQPRGPVASRSWQRFQHGLPGAS